MTTESTEQAGSTTTAADGSKVVESQAAATTTQPEAKAEQAQTTQETKTEPVKTEDKPKVPEKYDVKLPEGSMLTAQKLEELTSYAKEKGLTNEQAQELLNQQSNAVSEHMKSIHDSYVQKVESWKQDSMKDPDLGGDKFGENVELAKRAVEQFSTPEFKKLLDETGFGNHKEVLRLFANIGRQMGEGKIHNPGSQSADTTTPEQRRYPTMFPKG